MKLSLLKRLSKISSDSFENFSDFSKNEIQENRVQKATRALGHIKGTRSGRELNPLLNMVSGDMV